jgi:hypothetical protein
MISSFIRKAGKLLPAVVMTVGLAGCAHEHHHRERVVGVVETPVVVDGIDVIDDPDPFVVERERFYVGRPDDIRIVNNVVYYRGVRIDDPREARAARLALQAREARRHQAVRHAEAVHARHVHEERVERVR